MTHHSTILQGLHRQPQHIGFAPLRSSGATPMTDAKKPSSIASSHPPATSRQRYPLPDIPFGDDRRRAGRSNHKQRDTGRNKGRQRTTTSMAVSPTRATDRPTTVAGNESVRREGRQAPTDARDIPAVKKRDSGRQTPRLRAEHQENEGEFSETALARSVVQERRYSG